MPLLIAVITPDMTTDMRVPIIKSVRPLSLKRVHSSPDARIKLRTCSGPVGRMPCGFKALIE